MTVDTEDQYHCDWCGIASTEAMDWEYIEIDSDELHLCSPCMAEWMSTVIHLDAI